MIVLPPDIKEWTVPILCTWLEYSNLSQLAKAFAENGIDGPALLNFASKDINGIVPVEEDRKKLSKSIDKFRYANFLKDKACSVHIAVETMEEFKKELNPEGDTYVAAEEELLSLQSMKESIDGEVMALAVEDEELWRIWETRKNKRKAEKIKEELEASRYPSLATITHHLLHFVEFKPSRTVL